MEYSDEELKQQGIEYEKYINARVAELLGHDPELVELYHRSQKWKLDAVALQGQVIDLLESDEYALGLQHSMRNHKNLGSRVRESPPHEFLSQGVASDCAEALEVAAENLRASAEGLRRRIAELPPLEVKSQEQWNAVEKAGLQARTEAAKKYLT